MLTQLPDNSLSEITTSSGRAQQLTTTSKPGCCALHKHIDVYSTLQRVQGCTDTCCSPQLRHKSPQTSATPLRKGCYVSFLSGRNEIEKTTLKEEAELHFTLGFTLSASPAAISTKPSCSAHETQALFLHRLPCEVSIFFLIYPLILFFWHRIFLLV